MLAVTHRGLHPAPDAARRPDRGRMIAWMSGGREIEIPIFELPLVALPGERVPLHIFEDRYKRMIGHALETAEPFGILLRDEEEPREVGCSASVEQVLERFDDGRMNIVALGVERFRVVDQRGGEEDPRALVEPLAEAGADADPADAHSAFAALVEAVGGEMPTELAGTAYGIAARVELPVEFKQELLETDEEERRMIMVRTQLRRLAAQAKRTAEMAEIARTNGHGPVDGLAR